MFEDALRYPWSGEETVETIAIGGVLSLFGVLVIPVFLVYGYLVGVLRRTMAGETETPPTFGDWGALFVEGLKAFVVTVVYGIVPGLVLTAAAFAWFVPVVVVSSGGSETAAAGALGLGILGGLLLMVVALLVGLAAVYLIPAALVAMIRADALGAAFSPGKVWRVAANAEYATAWVVAAAVNVVVGILAGAVAATGIGALLVPFLNFYGLTAATYAIGVGVSEVPAVEAGDRPADEHAAA